MQYRYLLISRYALINVVAVALSVAAYLQGWLDGIFEAHLRELSGLIFLVFLYGMALCGAKIWRYGGDLNDLGAGTPDPRSQSGQYLARARAGDGEGRGIQAQALRLKLTDRIVVIRQIADSLIFLGLIGTVIGFIVALSGVDPSAADRVENVSAMVATLISGMSVALHTTLVGAVLYVWLIINYRILVSGTVDLIAATLELGEADAGP